MLVTLKTMMQDNAKNGSAVGAFNTVNLASVRAVIDAAEKLKKPVILQHAQIHEKVAPLKVIGPIMLQAAQNAQVPVCVHLDHGEDIAYLGAAMKMGFTSVMFDGSSLNYEDNIAGTCAVVELAQKYNVSVEAELGRVLRPEGGLEASEEEGALTPEACYTKPEEAKQFVEATGIDALAIAFGTAHGIYDAEPKLDFNRIAEIQNKLHLPLVMHGGSGVGDEEFKEAIKNGIAKVNYFTYMSLAGGNAIRSFLNHCANPSKIRYDELSEVARTAMQEHVEHAIRIFSGLA